MPWLAGVALTVAVEVGLAGVGDRGTVVGGVVDPVAVGVAGRCGVTRVAGTITITITIGLPGVGDRGAVVSRVVDTITIGAPVGVESHASPTPSPSASTWPGFASDGQLSAVSSTPSASVSSGA